MAFMKLIVSLVLVLSSTTAYPAESDSYDTNYEPVGSKYLLYLLYTHAQQLSTLHAAVILQIVLQMMPHWHLSPQRHPCATITNAVMVNRFSWNALLEPSCLQTTALASTLRAASSRVTVAVNVTTSLLQQLYRRHPTIHTYQMVKVKVTAIVRVNMQVLSIHQMWRKMAATKWNQPQVSNWSYSPMINHYTITVMYWIQSFGNLCLLGSGREGYSNSGGESANAVYSSDEKKDSDYKMEPVKGE